MSWFSKRVLRPTERAVKKLLRDEPWLKEALRGMAQDELLRLHEQVIGELRKRLPPDAVIPIPWREPPSQPDGIPASGFITTSDDFEITFVPGDIPFVTRKPTIYGGDQ